MPAIQPPQRVLLTGASGFIAVHIAIALVKTGFEVVGTVRSSAKGDYLVSLVGSKFSYVIVEDIELPTAFDEAIKNGRFDAIVHTASPVSVSGGSKAEEVIGPAVAGTKNVLISTKNYGPTVKRVVITASTASIFEPKEHGHVFTENDWNKVSQKIVEETPDKANGWDIYRASKSIAEQAAWKFIEDEKPHFDLVTIHPPLVWGPLIQQSVKSIESLNASSEFLASWFLRSPETEEYTNFVHVQSVAEAHSLALVKEKAGGERFIISAGEADFYQWKKAALDAGVPGIGKLGKQSSTGAPFIYANEKSKEILGLEYIGWKETLFDSIASFQKLLPASFPSK